MHGRVEETLRGGALRQELRPDWTGEAHANFGPAMVELVSPRPTPHP